MTHSLTALFTGDPSSGAAVVVGLASAASFATSNALQHRAAGTVPGTVRTALAVLGHLARQRAWVLATCISLCALVLHAVALRLGPIALVQPLMLVGVVLAVPIRSALARTMPRWCEIRAVCVTVVGLTGFVVSATPATSTVEPRRFAGGIFVLGCFAGGLCALRASRVCGRSAAGQQARLLGAGAGIMFGTTAGLLKVVGTAVTTAGSAHLALLLGVLVLAGLLGTAMNQKAYQIAPISLSMPMVNVVDIMVAVSFGAVAFGEVPRHDPAALLVEVASLGCVGIGLRLISRLPVGRLESAPTLLAAGQPR